MSVIYMPDIEEIEMDASCGMKRWWYQYEAGQGIANVKTLPAELLRKALLQDLANVAPTMPDISDKALQDLIQGNLDELPSDVRVDRTKMELVYRRLGLFVAWMKFREPTIRAVYEDVDCSDILILDREPLWITFHPSRVIKDKQTGDLMYREFVPMPPGSWPKPWSEGWIYNLRLHAAIIATAEDLKLTDGKEPGKLLNKGQVIGINEGYHSQVDGRLIHPYVWGFRNTQTGEWTHNILNKGPNWVAAPVWEYPGGLVDWVGRCGETTAQNMFPLSPAVTADKEMSALWFGGITHRERALHNAVNQCRSNVHLRSVYFPRNTASCRPGVMGEQCAYLQACWRKDLQQDPLQSENFIPRSALKKGESITGVVTA